MFSFKSALEAIRHSSVFKSLVVALVEEDLEDSSDSSKNTCRVCGSDKEGCVCPNCGVRLCH